MNAKELRVGDIVTLDYGCMNGSEEGIVVGPGFGGCMILDVCADSVTRREHISGNSSEAIGWRLSRGMESDSAQVEAAERVAMRRWLVIRGIDPSMGCNESSTRRLINQVRDAGGDPDSLMQSGRDRVKKLATV